MDLYATESGVFEEEVHEELSNIFHRAPLEDTETLSFRTSNECRRRGWTVRDDDGMWTATSEGLNAHLEWL